MSPSRKTTSQIFGGILQDLRSAKGLSQEDLAHACGKHRTYISLLENGRHSPSLDTLLALANALGTSATEIVRRIEAAKPRR